MGDSNTVSAPPICAVMGGVKLVDEGAVHHYVVKRMRLLPRFRARRRATAVIRRRRSGQYERAHEVRKGQVTLANKNGMGFNGL